MPQTTEQTRLQDDGHNWKRWGPYLSERQWGTVREDYSENGDAWNFFPHDHARSRAYNSFMVGAFFYFARKEKMDSREATR